MVPLYATAFIKAPPASASRIVVVARNNNNIATKSRSELSIPGYAGNVTRSGMRGGGENPHDAFVDLEGALEIVVRSKKSKAVELTK